MLFVQSAGLKEKPCKHEDKAVAVATATALIYVKLIDFKGNKNKDGCKKVLPSERTSNENLPKSTGIAAFWQSSYYSCLAY